MFVKFLVDGVVSEIPVRRGVEVVDQPSQKQSCIRPDASSDHELSVSVDHHCSDRELQSALALSRTTGGIPQTDRQTSITDLVVHTDRYSNERSAAAGRGILHQSSGRCP